MSFLVVNNGQFAPLITSSNSKGALAAVYPITGLGQVHEFKEALSEAVDNDHSKKSHQSLEVYKVAAKKFEEQRKRFYAKDIMSSPVKLISQHAQAVDAKELLLKYGFRHLPVVNEQQVIIGMITDRELMGDLENKVCSEIMQKVIVCEEHTSINEIAIILLREKINALPIINHKREIIGIITLSDILKFVIESTMFLTKA